MLLFLTEVATPPDGLTKCRRIRQIPWGTPLHVSSRLSSAPSLRWLRASRSSQRASLQPPDGKTQPLSSPRCD
jgi:hypothetical protein